MAEEMKDLEKKKNEARFKAREEAKAVVLSDNAATWVVTFSDTVQVTEEEGAPSDYKIRLFLTGDPEYGGEPSLGFEIMSSERMPYKALWTELVKGSVVTFDFYEDKNKGYKVHNYLIPRLEPGSPRDPK